MSGRWVIVRTPSWGPTTYHLSHASLVPRHREDATRLGVPPLPDQRLLETLEEGGPVCIADSERGSVSYSLEPLSD